MKTYEYQNLISQKGVLAAALFLGLNPFLQRVDIARKIFHFCLSVRTFTSTGAIENEFLPKELATEFPSSTAPDLCGTCGTRFGLTIGGRVRNSCEYCYDNKPRDVLDSTFYLIASDLGCCPELVEYFFSIAISEFCYHGYRYSRKFRTYGLSDGEEQQLRIPSINRDSEQSSSQSQEI